jgi:hypothetical protein
MGRSVDRRNEQRSYLYAVASSRRREIDAVLKELKAVKAASSWR